VTFDTGKLAELPVGWKRDFLIYSEGWIKDGDFNTAYGKTVDPLPYHGLSCYPCAEDQNFPSDAEHRAYRENYNTRSVSTDDFRQKIMAK